MPESKLYENFRAMGYYTNHIPFQTMYHEGLKEHFIITCVGKSYHIYNASKLAISRVSNVQEDEITCLTSSGNRIYVAVKNNIFSYERNKQDVLKFLMHEQEVHSLVPFGKHIISVDVGSNVIVWTIQTQEPYVEMTFNNDSFEISCVHHPATYVNKILFGSAQGSLQLWNIKTNHMVYEFVGWGHGVTVIKQAPTVDVVGIGLSSGDIIIHNLKYDETVMKFKQEWGPVSSLAFRSDGSPIMISGSTVGHMAVWNLAEKRVCSQMRNAHECSVTGLECLPNEPIMVTSSRDNQLKMWIFDQTDGGARLLRSRGGHSASVSTIRFYDDTTLISASLDRTMCQFSTYHESKSKPMGKAVYNKKADVKKLLPPFTQVCTENRRSSDWSDTLAVHSSCPTVSLWRTQEKTVGQLIKPVKTVNAMSCAMSPCGNFGFIGYQDGEILMINMQSRIVRGTFKGGHTGVVRCLACDNMSAQLISAGADSQVIIWLVKAQRKLTSIAVPSSVSAMKLHRESAMVGVALDDFTLLIIDLETRRIVRKFPGHNGRITDLTFNPSGKWFITSSMDCTVCTWDLLTSSLIDRVSVDQAVTSLDMSPNGEFLALAMIDEPGVFLWSNKTLYSHVSLKALSMEGEELNDLDNNFKTADQLDNELVTLSLLPESRWANLLKLDVIKFRNTVRAAPMVSKKVPFFLPTTTGILPKFAMPTKDEQAAVVDTQYTYETGMDRVLLMCIETSDAKPFMEHMKTLGVAAIESEIKNLKPKPSVEPDLMLAFLKVTKMALQTNKDYELIQSYLALFLKVHNWQLMTEYQELLDELAEVQEAAKPGWERLDAAFNKAICLVTYQRSAIL